MGPPPDARNFGGCLKAHIDFETRSGCALPRAGASKYSEHPSTEVMCLGVAFDDEEPEVVGVALTKNPTANDLAILNRITSHVSSGGICVAHNAPFELAIWNNVGVLKYGWPELRPEQMDCTMARAYAMSLPGSLDGSRAAVGITVEKDMKGNRLMLKMSQPKTRKICPVCEGRMSWECPLCDGCGELYTWYEDPEETERLFAYCATDIVVERALDKRLAPLSHREKQIWLLDYKINNAGVKVDTEAAKFANTIVDFEETRLDEEMRQATVEQVATCKAHIQLKNWINGQGVETPGVAKNDITALLAKPHLPHGIRVALNIRQEAAKTSTAKLAAMLDRAGTDARLRGMFQYWGANTGRWAARGVQLQNLPRPTIELEEIALTFNIMSTAASPEAARDLIETLVGRPMEVISSCVRGFLISSPGKDFIAVDFASIESRITAWFAGEESVLQVFRTHGKIYEYQAALIYRVLFEEITKKDPRRQVGKATNLGFGFEGGVGAIQKICKSVGITMEPAFEGLWKLASQQRRDNALKRYRSEVTKAINKAEKENKKAGKIVTRIIPGMETGINEKEWLASELAKLAWRETNPNIVKFWKLIEAAAIAAVQEPGTVHYVHPVESKLPSISYCVRGSFLQCTLPSGRKITYPYPKLSEEETPWGAKKWTLTYMTEDSETHKWVRTPTYGGSLTENSVQGFARDLLANALLELDRRGESIVMHVHDEAVLEVDERMSRGVDFKLHYLEKVMAEVPAWASGLPMAAEGWRDKRYRK